MEQNSFVLVRKLDLGAARPEAPWRDTVGVLHGADAFRSVAAAFIASSVRAGKELHEVYGSGQLSDSAALRAALGGRTLYVNESGTETWNDLDGVGVLRISAGARRGGSAHVEGYAAAEKVEQVRAALAEFLKPFDPPGPPPQAEGKAFVLAKSDFGLYLRATPKIAAPLVRENYEDDVLEGYDHIVADLKSFEPCGRLCLLRGIPGGGKTHMLRGLVDEVKSVDRLCVIVPPAMAKCLGDPGLVDVFLKNDHDAATTILVVEDADQAVRTRGESNMPDVAAVLNLSDGLLGKALDLRVVATTNAAEVEVDAAMRRKGRMCREVSIGALGIDRAVAVATRLSRKIDADREEPWTLADIYAADRDPEVALAYAAGVAKAARAGDRGLLSKAAWTQAFINDLPDAAFAGILAGGFKDASGKTVPRSLRLLPHHKASVKSPDEHGSVDIPHLRNALARLEHTNAPAALKARMRKHLEAHAQEVLPSHMKKDDAAPAAAE